MKPTDLLREDHRSINSMLEILETFCKELESGATVEPEDLDTILAFIRSFVAPHHMLVENLVFTAVEEAGVSKEGGAMLVMMTERNSLREHRRNLYDAVAEYRKAGRNGADKLVESARSYVSILRHEMEIEEQDIYPRLDTHQSMEQQRELFAKLERLETHEKYDALERLLEMKGRLPL
jgi:hemerythrin-like domain-containing protein